MSHCVLKSCKNYAAKIKKDGGISYYRFPCDPARRSKWIDIVTSAHDNDFIPSKSGRVCSQHFLQSDMYTTDKGIRKLKSDAVPSVIEKYVPGKYPIGRPRKHPKLPPKPKRPKNITAKLPENKIIITTVYYFLQNEYEKLKRTIDGCDLRPLENILQRTAEATGVTEEVVTAILERDHRPKDVPNDSIPEESRVLCKDINNGNASSIEEEESCESADDDQNVDNGGQQEQRQFDVETETVKMEVVDEFEANMAVNHSLPSRYPEIKVKIEPNDEEYLEQQYQVQSSSSVHHVSNTIPARIKMETCDDDIRNNPMEVPSNSQTNESMQPEVKSEPHI